VKCDAPAEKAGTLVSVIPLSEDILQLEKSESS
jgi:hypothetical protein